MTDVMSGAVLVKNGNTYKNYANNLVEQITNGFGVLTDWETEIGRRVYYTHPEYPGYEFTIRTWSAEEHTENRVLVEYTVYREPTSSS